MHLKGSSEQEYFENFYSGRDWRFYRGILSTIINHCEPGPILDLGAGLGYFVEAAQLWGMDCQGFDGSAVALEMARQRFPKIRLGLHSLSDRLPFDDQAFNSVLLNQVIEHLEPAVAENVISEAYRVLRTGGTLYVTSPCKYNRRECEADPSHIYCYTPSELTQLLKSKGFDRILQNNQPLELLGQSKFGKGLMRIIFYLLKWDKLSSSANCLAFRV